MGINYQFLKLFCDRANITYQEFGAMVDSTGLVSWNTIYQVITGRTTPGKKVRRALDRYISRNRKKIEKVLGRSMGVDSVAAEYHEAV